MSWLSWLEEHSSRGFDGSPQSSVEEGSGTDREGGGSGAERRETRGWAGSGVAFAVGDVNPVLLTYY